jgi:endonuclease/exonuclease/phosphatase family metal-dependent hydrolase
MKNQIHKLISAFLLTISFLASPNAEAREIRVLTFNAWFLPGIQGVIEISKDDTLRLEKMPDLLASTGADVIALQEVWTGAARDALKEAMYERGYKFVAEKEDVEWSKWLCLQGMLIGNGLIVFSRYEIGPDIHQTVFSNYTRMDEYFTVKGAIHFQINLPDIGWADFYNTHLGAVSFDPATSDFDPKQMETLSQHAEEFVEFISNHQSTPTQIVAGDMNQHPFKWDPKARKHLPERGPVYEILTDKGSLLDTFWGYRRPADSIYTFDKNKNCYVFNGAFAESPDEYLDYIFVKAGNQALRVVESTIVLDRPIDQLDDGRQIFLSDHAAVLTVFSTQTK